MKILGYLYALIVALILTFVISNFYNVVDVMLKGILLTLLYIFIVHFAQGEHCLVNNMIGIESNPKKQRNDFIMDGFNKNNNDNISELLSEGNLSSKVHANTLYNTDVSDENRLRETSNNNMYYALTNQFYPMNNQNQINQQDCTNDGSCLIQEDQLNMHPVKQTLKEVLPVPYIGPQELTIMNRLNPKLNSSINYPVPIESHQSCPSMDIHNFYKIDQNILNNEKNKGCSKCSLESFKDFNDYKNEYDNDIINKKHGFINNNDNNDNNDNNETKKEMFGLFDTYNMINHESVLYKNAPLNGQLCRSCVSGTCNGDLCTSDPPLQRNDPLDM